MIQHSSHIDDLIARCASGEANAAHWEELAAWCDLDVNNARYVDQMMAAAALGEKGNTPQFDSKAAWNEVDLKLKEKKVINFWTLVASAAAVVVVLFVVFRPSADKHDYAAIDTIKKETLADGSEIVLNRGAKLATAYKASSGKMEVTLEGEAFFDLNKKQSENFEVLTGDLIIRDIGTSFNVKAPIGNDTIWISVNEGIVEATADGDLKKVLQAGESAFYLRSQRAFVDVKEEEIETIAPYKDRKFSFKNAPLRRIVRQLNEVYDQQLILKSEQIGSCRMTVTFDNESIESIATIIAETLELQSTPVKGGIELQGKGCE